jgi:hypothetical protein
MLPHFTKRVFELQEIVLFYINQVRGATFPNHTIPDATRSEKDGGIQCHPDGPDVVPFIIPIPREGRDMNVNFSSLETPTCIQPFLRHNSSEASMRQRNRKRKKSQKQQSDDKDLETLVKKWTMPPTKLPSDDYEVCALFVSNENGDPLTPEELASHGDASNLFFFPSPCSVDDGPSCLQQFYGIPASKYNTVLDEINGISPEAARSVLAAHCQTNGYSILAWGKGGVKNQGSYTPVVAGQRVRRSRRHQRSRSSRS